MNVPRIKLASINVTAVLRVAVTMVFNTHTKKWTSTAKQFRVELLSFKGYLLIQPSPLISPRPFI